MSRVFLGRLPMDTRESDIERFMRGYGHIRDITLKKGYGFVEFDDYRDAEDAIDDLNGKELLGEKVILEVARGRRSSTGGGRGGGGGGGGRDRGRGYVGSSSRRPVWLDKYPGNSGRQKYGPPVRTGYAAVVENLSSRTSWQDLKDYCRKYGKVTYADAHKRRVGEGIIEFESRNDLQTVIDKLDDTELGGKRIRIYAEKSKDYRRSRSYSRSRSKSPRKRSRSRSRSRSVSPKRRGRSGSRSPSRSRSRSPVKSRSDSPPANDKADDSRDTD